MVPTMTAPVHALPAVILAAHGSSRHPDSARPILELAAALRARGPWIDTACAFMKQEPLLARALERVAARQVVIVPVFAGRGYYTDVLIPRVMGLDGPLTRRDGRVLRLTAPVGCDARIPHLMAARAEAVMRAGGLDPARSGLLLIAHGSGRPGGAGDTAKSIAAAIAAMGRFGEVRLAFLEQAPFARDWPALMRGSGDMVALPLLVAQGLHASQDIPPLFGLRPGQAGPVECHGRRVWLAAGLGAEPELVEIVADLVAGAGTG